MSISIKGDFNEAQDAGFEVESYDEGITLITVTVDGNVYPVEVSNSNALLLADQIIQAATSN
jgi:hypothetical protein